MTAAPLTMREKIRAQHKSGALAKEMCLDACYCTNGVKLLDDRAKLVRVTQLVAVLLAAPTTRFGKPEFHSGPQSEAREEIRRLAVVYNVQKADSVLYQTSRVVQAVLHELGEAS
jgi:hypothetical protein